MNLVSMPRSVNSDNMLNLDLNTESENQNDVKKHNFRTRKLTPRIMPSSGKIIRSTTVESIEEQDIETEQENIGEFERGLDGTFMIPKLNKTEVAPKPTFKSEGIKVDLRHHCFESQPLVPEKEESSNVILGKFLYEMNDEGNIKQVQNKSRYRKISKGSETLALVIEEAPKVVLDVVFSFKVLVCFQCSICKTLFKSYVSKI